MNAVRHKRSWRRKTASEEKTKKEEQLAFGFLAISTDQLSQSIGVSVIVPRTNVVPFAVPRFPRTMGDDLNAVASAGFVLTYIGEPQPSQAACKAVPRFTRWRNLGAFLLLIMARRP